MNKVFISVCVFVIHHLFMVNSPSICVFSGFGWVKNVCAVRRCLDVLHSAYVSKIIVHAF